MTTDENVRYLLTLDEMAVEPSAAPDGAGWWDVWGTPGGDLGEYATTVSGEQLLEAVTAGVSVYDRRTGADWAA